MATMECMVDAEETSQPNGLANLRYPGVFIQKKKRASMAYRTHSCTGSCSSVDSLESPGATDSRAGMCDSPVSSDSQSQHARSADQLGVLGEGTSEQGLCVPPMEPSAKISFVGQRTSSPRTYISNPELRPQPPSPPVPVPTYYGGCLPHPPATGSPGPSMVRVGPPALPPPPYPTNRFATASQRHQQPPPPQPPQPPPVPYHLHSPYCIPGPQGPGPLPAPQLGQSPQRPPVARRALFPGAVLEPHHSPVTVGPQVGFHSPAPFPALPPHTVAAPPAPPSTSAAPAAPRPALAAPRGAAGPLRAPVPHSQQLLESLAQLHASAASAEGVPPTSPIVPQDPSSPAAVSGPLVGEDGAVVMLQKVMENSSAPDEKAAVDPRKYKTRLCKNWLEHGECVYAHTCCFAHGPEELRTLVDNHKTLASIGYFSNVVLLAMTNGKKPALPPHSLYQQPPLFSAPTSAKALQECAASVPQEWAFPFRDPLPAALKDLGQDRTADASVKRKGHRGKSHRNVYGANGGRARGGRAAQVAASEDYALDSEVTA